MSCAGVHTHNDVYVSVRTGPDYSNHRLYDPPIFRNYTEATAAWKHGPMGNDDPLRIETDKFPTLGLLADFSSHWKKRKKIMVIYIPGYIADGPTYTGMCVCIPPYIFLLLFLFANSFDIATLFVNISSRGPAIFFFNSYSKPAEQSTFKQNMGCIPDRSNFSIYLRLTTKKKRDIYCLICFSFFFRPQNCTSKTQSAIVPLNRIIMVIVIQNTAEL